MFDIYLLISSDSDAPEKKAIPANVLQPKYLNNFQDKEDEAPNEKLDENRFVFDLPCAQHSEKVRLFNLHFCYMK